MPHLDINLPGRSYRVWIDAGLLRRLGEFASELKLSRRILLAVDSAVATTHGQVARAALEQAGFEPVCHLILARESEKTLETVRAMYDEMLRAGLDRRSAVVAVGGGIVGDTAGFAAATFHRGVPLVQVPTTLLAMVDASIGGKTGVNHPLPGKPELGKNLIGAFWQPCAVVVDPLVLETLDDRQLRCGLAECVKHALLADAALLDWIDAHASAVRERSLTPLTELIRRCASIKAGFVSSDEREAGRRALLNLGHTFAHAIEPIAELDCHHGEAVAIGLAAAAHCSLETGRLTGDDAAHVSRVLSNLGLPCRLPRPVGVDRLIELMRFDKKAVDDRLRLVLPIGLGAAEVVDDLPLPLIRSAWRSVGAEG